MWCPYLIHKLWQKHVWTTTDQLKCSRDVLPRNLTGRTCFSPWLRQIGVGQREEWNPNSITLSQHVESFKVKWGMKGHWRHSTHYPHMPGAHHSGLIAADRAALKWCRGPFRLRVHIRASIWFQCHSCILCRLLPAWQHLSCAILTDSKVSVHMWRFCHMYGFSAHSGKDVSSLWSWQCDITQHYLLNLNVVIRHYRTIQMS